MSHWKVQCLNVVRKRTRQAFCQSRIDTHTHAIKVLNKRNSFFSHFFLASLFSVVSNAEKNLGCDDDGFCVYK